MNEADAKKLVGDFAVAVAYLGDAARVAAGDKIVAALVGQSKIPAARTALDALQVAIEAWGQTESPPSVIREAIEALRTYLSDQQPGK